VGREWNGRGGGVTLLVLLMGGVLCRGRLGQMALPLLSSIVLFGRRGGIKVYLVGLCCCLWACYVIYVNSEGTEEEEDDDDDNDR
jgi:hypothetical protein